MSRAQRMRWANTRNQAKPLIRVRDNSVRQSLGTGQTIADFLTVVLLGNVPAFQYSSGQSGPVPSPNPMDHGVNSAAAAPARVHDRRKVLIVDDHSEVLKVLRTSLEHHGYIVCGEAENGIDAIARAIATRPDLVILDVAMLGLNGIEVASAAAVASGRAHNSPHDLRGSRWKVLWRGVRYPRYCGENRRGK
jgi:hypothetical protein